VFDELRRREVAEHVVVTEADLRAELAARPRDYQRPATVTLRHAFTPLAAPAPDAKAAAAARVDAARLALRDRAERARRAGKLDTFGDALGPLRYATGDRAFGDGLLADPVLRATADGLAPGAVSPVVQTADGLHVLVCVARTPAGPATFDDARAELERVVRARRYADALDRWMQHLRERWRAHVVDGGGA
jgi:parvulin-like peptidyl-prolyl isomerase